MVYHIKASQLSAVLLSLSAQRAAIERDFEIFYESYKDKILSEVTNLRVSWLPWNNRITCPDEFDRIDSLIDKESSDIGWSAVIQHIGRTYGLGVMLEFRRAINNISWACDRLASLKREMEVLDSLSLVGALDNNVEGVSLDETEFEVYTAAILKHGI